LLPKMAFVRIDSAEDFLNLGGVSDFQRVLPQGIEGSVDGVENPDGIYGTERVDRFL
jgi:hypothetical protein